MARVKRGVTARARHKKILRLAEGMGGTRHRLFKPANEAVMHSLAYAYRDRKKRKGDMRALWIARINAGARQNGLPYNQFMHGLKGAGIDLNRKMLAELAVLDEPSFASLVTRAKSALAASGARAVAQP
jgi:large subunit ribosomal protein L20